MWLKTKYDESQLEIITLRRDCSEFEQGVAGMDLQIQAIESENLQKQKASNPDEWNKGSDSIAWKARKGI